MLYRVPGDPKTGYDLGIGTGTYGGYVPWVRTRYGYGTWVRSVGTAYWYGVPTGTVRGYTVPVVLRRYGVPTDRTHVPYPRTVPIPYRTQKHVPTYRTHTQKYVPTYRTVPNPPRYVHRTPPWCSDRKPWFHNS